VAVTSFLTGADRVVKATLEEVFGDSDAQYCVFFEELCDPDEDEHRVACLSVYVSLPMPGREATPEVAAVATASWGLPLEEAMHHPTLMASVRERAEALLFQRTMYLEQDIAAMGVIADAAEGDEPAA
jgi:hypothetical protein